MNSKVYKSCAVPQCLNTSINSPNKLFVYVPHDKTTRVKWLKLARRDPKAIKLTTCIYFCEDHFDLPNTMDNFMEYHVMGSVSQVRMKLGCVPTKFQCQADRRKRTSEIIERPHILKKRRTPLKEGSVQDLEEKTTPVKHMELETSFETPVVDEDIRKTSNEEPTTADNLVQIPKEDVSSSCPTEAADTGADIEESMNLYDAHCQDKCRACLKDLAKQRCYDLFQAWDKPWALPGSLLVNDLSEIANVQILKSDPYSKLICLNCFDKLQEACLFIVTVRKSDILLRKASVDSCNEWPKPMIIEKQKIDTSDNGMEVQVKQEVLSDAECDTDDMTWEYQEPQLDIKIEPEEIVAPTPTAFASFSSNILGQHTKTDNVTTESEDGDNKSLTGSLGDEQNEKESADQNGLIAEKFSEESSLKSRKYEHLRRGRQPEWSPASMAAAIEAVKNGMSYKEASKEYSVNVLTLTRKVRQLKRLELGVFEVRRRKANHKVFTAEQEKEIVNHIKDLETIMHGLTKMEVLKLAYQAAVKDSIRHPFKHERAGLGWLRGFTRRHPDIKFRVPECTSPARARAFANAVAEKFNSLPENPENVKTSEVDEKNVWIVPIENAKYLDTTLKEEPMSCEETSKYAVTAPQECILCTKQFNTVLGLKAHVISKHSYKTVKRKDSPKSEMEGPPKSINEDPPNIETEGPLKPENGGSPTDEAEDDSSREEGVPRVHFCFSCRKAFKSRRDLMVHRPCNHPQESPAEERTTCSLCGAQFTTFLKHEQHKALCRAKFLPKSITPQRTNPNRKSIQSKPDKTIPQEKPNITVKTEDEQIHEDEKVRETIKQTIDKHVKTSGLNTEIVNQENGDTDSPETKKANKRKLTRVDATLQSVEDTKKTLEIKLEPVDYERIDEETEDIDSLENKNRQNIISKLMSDDSNQNMEVHLEINPISDDVKLQTSGEDKHNINEIKSEGCER